MQEKSYRESIRDALVTLKISKNSVFHSMVEISLSGELKDWGVSNVKGVGHALTMDDFKCVNDPNVQILCELIEKIECVFEHIHKLNNFTGDDKAVEDNGIDELDDYDSYYSGI